MNIRELLSALNTVHHLPPSKKVDVNSTVIAQDQSGKTYEVTGWGFERNLVIINLVEDGGRR